MDSRLKESVSLALKNLTSTSTPSFVFNLKLLEENYHFFKKTIASGNCSVRYAMKANNQSEVVQKLKSLGSGFEIASPGELAILKSLSVDAHKIFFSQPVKIPDHIKEAFDYGITHFGFDSYSELEKLAILAPGSSVYLRIHVSNTGASWKLDHKFGASKKDWMPLCQKALELKLKLEGITFHVGWNNNSIDTWKMTLQTVSHLVQALSKKGIKIKYINLGGGFPAHRVDQMHFLNEIALVINPIIKRLTEKFGLKVFAEPGTFLVANCGYLLTKIYAKIKRGSIYWLYVDASMTNGFYWILAGLNYEIVGMGNNHHISRKKILYNVTGPTCDSHETFQKKIRLSRDLTVGDFLIISPAGAYISSAREYNSIPYPKTQFVK